MLPCGIPLSTLNQDDEIGLQCVESSLSILNWTSSAVAERPRDASCLSVVSFNIPTAQFLPRDAMHKRGLCRHAVSVCLSVTFESCIKTIKISSKFFSPSGSQAILVFPCETGWRYSDGNPHNGGVECKWTSTTGTSDLLGGADTINQLSVITLRITLRRKVTTNEATYFEVWNIEG